MANNTEITSALDKVISIFEETKLNDCLSELSKLYSTSHANSGEKTKTFKNLCKKEEWANFSISEMNFLKSFEIYPYMGENSYITCVEAISNNFNDHKSIGNILIIHWSGSIKALESCKKLSKALNDGHFTENKDFNIDQYIEKADFNAILKGVNTILDGLKERLELTEDEIKKLNERMEELKEDLQKKSPNRWKRIAEFSIQTAITECIKDPTKIQHALGAFGLIKMSVIQGLPIAKQLGVEKIVG